MYRFLLAVMLFSSGMLKAQIPNRYIDEVFSDITETKSIPFSVNVPQPKPDYSNIVVLLGGPKIAVLEHDTENVTLRMDLFEPTGDVLQKRPVIILCFGGGFVQGSRDYWSIRLLAQGLARRGYVVASIDYRLGMQIDDKELGARAVYRGIQDGRSAVRFFKAHAAQYKIDTDHIFIGGHSAGAFVALHNLYLDKESERPSSTYDTLQDGQPIDDLGCLDCAGDNLSFSGKANGVFSLAGAVGDLAFLEDANEAPPILFHSIDDGTVPYSVGEPFSDLSSNPFVTFDLPTVYGSEPIHSRCAALNIPSEFNSYTNRGHGVHENGTVALYPDILPAISNWFYDQYLKPLTPEMQGPERFCSENATQNYSIAEGDFAYFDWGVTGGVLSGNTDDHEVSVTWDPEAALNQIKLTPYLENGVQGETRTVTPESADGGTVEWVGGSGNWDDPIQWSTNHPPLFCENVSIPANAQILLSTDKIVEIKTLTLNQDANLLIPSTTELRITKD